MSFKLIFQLIRAASAFTLWYKKASEDGKIDPDEMSTFLNEFAEIFGINISVKPPEVTD